MAVSILHQSCTMETKKCFVQCLVIIGWRVESFYSESYETVWENKQVTPYTEWIVFLERQVMEKYDLNRKCSNDIPFVDYCSIPRSNKNNPVAFLGKILIGWLKTPKKSERWETDKQQINRLFNRKKQENTCVYSLVVRQRTKVFWAICCK